MALNDDKSVLPDHNGERKSLAGEIPEAPLRDQIPKKLLKKAREMDLGSQINDMWTQGNADRQEWLSTQATLLQEFEEFIAPIYTGAYAWSSTIHLPVSYTICRTFHSRMLSALMSFDPPFTAIARKEANTDRAPVVQDLLRYAFKDWANEYQGLEDVLDRWLWSWITSGRGILKNRWSKKYVKIMDVVQKQRQGPPRYEVMEDGTEVAIPTIESYEEEEERIITKCNGPQVDLVLPEDLLIIGGEGDVTAADAVIHQQYLTATELWTLVDQNIFEEDFVRTLIDSGRSEVTEDTTGMIKQARSEIVMDSNLDKTYDEDRYQILECYMTRDMDGSGIGTDIIVWMAPRTREIGRATYLHRVSQSGKRPFATIDFHKRTNTQNPVGLVELTYSLTKEMDSIHNMRLDFGLLSTLPFGFYRANSSMSTASIPLEPGALIPVDNPQTDVFFPNLGNRISWGMQEESALYQYIERMTSVSDLSLGILGNQGAARTATGSRIVNSENNSNLDVYLKRMNRGFKYLLHLLWEQVQMRIDPGMEFRVMGDDGQGYFRTVQSREEIAGSYDFELEGSSSASNKQVQLDTAQQIYTLTSNPLDIQLGIVTPAERFNAIKNLLQAMGVKNFSKFVRTPQNMSRRFTPEEIANRVLAGVDVPLGPEQDLEGFIAYAQYIFDHDELLGQFGEQQAIALHQKVQEAGQMMQALQEMQAQAANAQQMQNNAAMSQNQQTSPGGAAPAAAAPVA